MMADNFFMDDSHSETTKKEDNAFKLECKNGTITTAQTMHYLRKKNTREWKRYVVLMLIPAKQRDTVDMQCRIEGLI